MTKKQASKWLQAMMKAYHTDEAGVRQIMAERQRLSMEARKLKGAPHRGGFNNKELAKQAGRKGLNTRWGNTSNGT